MDVVEVDGDVSELEELEGGEHFVKDARASAIAVRVVIGDADQVATFEALELMRKLEGFFFREFAFGLDGDFLLAHEFVVSREGGKGHKLCGAVGAHGTVGSEVGVGGAASALGVRQALEGGRRAHGLLFGFRHGVLQLVRCVRARWRRR